MDYQTIIETFFSMLGRFDFDRAKAYIDGRKEILQKLAPTFPNQIQLMAMLSTFSHLAEVEKHYHNQPFQAQAAHSFLSTTNFLRRPKSFKDMYHDIFIELQQLEQLETTADKREIVPPTQPGPSSTSTTSSSSTGITGQHCDQQISSNSNRESSPHTTNQLQRSPGLLYSFFRVLSPIAPSVPANNTLPQAAVTGSPQNSAGSGGTDPYLMSTSSGYEPPPNSTTTTPIAAKDFTDELISHFCRQLQNYIQARLDMIDVYEKFTEASAKNYATVDGTAFRLSMLCRQYHKYFHHPLLAPIKESMTLECESLMTLIRVTIGLEHWRFLPVLIDLEDAQSKLNYWAASTFNKDPGRKRFKVTKTITPPRLYVWQCKFKDFLIAKFTLYFHDTLSKNLPATIFRNSCSKLCIDYYSKLSSFQRKIEALFITLMYDVTNEKDYRGLGYNCPTCQYQPPRGKNTLQPMVVIPNEARQKLSGLQAEIYMTVDINQQEMMKKGYYQLYDNAKKLTYAITKPDVNVFLVIVYEGQRPDIDAQLRAFALKTTSQLAFSSIFNN